MRTAHVPTPSPLSSTFAHRPCIARQGPSACLVLLILTALLSGCASPAAGALGTAAKIALEVSGLSKPELPEAQKPPYKVNMTMAAGKNLNASTRGQPLAAVMRIYKLKDAASFYQLPLDAFVDQGRDKTLLGDNLIESRDLTLIPDREMRWTETVPRAAGSVGVVVLFQSPNAQRWRFAFDTVEAEKTGIVMGAHACALTVTRGTPLASRDVGSAASGPAMNQLTQVNCTN